MISEAKFSHLFIFLALVQYESRDSWDSREVFAVHVLLFVKIAGELLLYLGLLLDVHWVLLILGLHLRAVLELSLRLYLGKTELACTFGQLLVLLLEDAHSSQIASHDLFVSALAEVIAKDAADTDIFEFGSSKYAFEGLVGANSDAVIEGEGLPKVFI